MTESEIIAIQQFSEFMRFKNAQSLNFSHLEAQALRALRDFTLNGSQHEGLTGIGSLRSMVEDVLPMMNGSQFDCGKLRGALSETFPDQVKEINQGSLYKTCSRMVDDGRLVKIGRAFKRAAAAVALVALIGCSTPKERSLMLPPLGMSSTQPKSVTLAWTASPDASVVGYNVYGVNGAITNQLDAGSSLSVVVSNLMVGTQYSFFATAYNAESVESKPSNVVTYTPTNPPPAPPSELRIVVTPQLSDGLDGPWTAVAEWPAITLTNPVGQRFYKMDIRQLQ